MRPKQKKTCESERAWHLTQPTTTPLPLVALIPAGTRKNTIFASSSFLVKVHKGAQSLIMERRKQDIIPTQTLLQMFPSTSATPTGSDPVTLTQILFGFHWSLSNESAPLPSPSGNGQDCPTARARFLLAWLSLGSPCTSMDTRQPHKGAVTQTAVRQPKRNSAATWLIINHLYSLLLGKTRVHPSQSKSTSSL